MAPFDRPLGFHVQSAVDKTQAFPHHDSITQLWELRWRDLCSKAEYPFGEAAFEDFEPVFASLIANFRNDATALVDNPDGYAAPFLPVAAALVRKAEECEKNKDTNRARDLFLRAAAVYRIARFPVNRSPLGQKAWELGRAAYLRGGAYLDPPVREVAIQFSHAKAGVDEADRPILANLRIPSSSSSPQQKPPNGWPILLLISGLDSYRSDSTTRTTAHLATGLAVLNVDIPGTADSPAAASDPSASDRLFSSVLDWIATTGRDEFQLDAARVVARGCSTGGYHALRLAHTHADRLLAVICHGGACHYMFEPDWIRAQDHMEYPFGLAEALAWKFGFRRRVQRNTSNDETISFSEEPDVEAYAREAGNRFSLETGQDAGMLDRRSCRLLIVNGLEDSVFPIEDSWLVASRGRPKEVRLLENRRHMGNPGGDEIAVEWASEVVRQAD
ncbi:hypothetical protein G7054_g2968 [Neopestalotiopsis clavispora]|nr:hypothetical protein G7054_g2968 [Neopestalotiopsis clavispora]